MKLRKPCQTCEGRGETYDEWAPLNRRTCVTCNGSGAVLVAEKALEVWWCRTHNAERIDAKHNVCYRSPTTFPTAEAETHRCHMVGMVLVPLGGGS